MAFLKLCLLVQQLLLFYKLVRLKASLPQGIALDMHQGVDGARDHFGRFLQIIG